MLYLYYYYIYIYMYIWEMYSLFIEFCNFSFLIYYIYTINKSINNSFCRENFSSIWSSYRRSNCSCCWRRCWGYQPCSISSSQGLWWRTLAKNDCLCKHFLNLTYFLVHLRICSSTLSLFYVTCRKEVGYCWDLLIWLSNTAMSLLF